MVSGRLLTGEQKRKYDLVRTILTNLLREVTGNQHYCAEYYVDMAGREWVDVTFNNEYSICKVDVTADSPVMLARDVLKKF